MKTLKWSYVGKKSGVSSVSLNQVQGFIYGSFSSTFLAYRDVILKNMEIRVNNEIKEINEELFRIESLKEDPFYCW